MANKMQIKRGNKAGMPVLSDGELGLCIDTNELFVGNGGANHPVALTGGANFIKFDDGTMIEWGSNSFPSVLTGLPWGALYISNSFDMDDYPEPFYAAPRVFADASRTNSSMFFLINHKQATKTNPGSYTMCSASGGGGALELIIDYLAIGRWKA